MSLTFLKRTSRRPGFTLTELLVVMAVLAILVALFIRNFTLYGYKLESLQCKSYLREMYSAFVAYEMDNDGYLPPGKPHIIGAGTESSIHQISSSSDWGGWRNYILPYMRPGQVVNQWGSAASLNDFPNCPVMTSGRPHGGTGVGYGGNRNAFWYAKTLSNADQWRVPGTFSMIVQCNWWQSIYSHTHAQANIGREFHHSPPGAPRIVNSLSACGTVIEVPIDDRAETLRYITIGNSSSGRWDVRTPYWYRP